MIDNNGALTDILKGSGLNLTTKIHQNMYFAFLVTEHVV